MALLHPRRVRVQSGHSGNKRRNGHRKTVACELAKCPIAEVAGHATRWPPNESEVSGSREDAVPLIGIKLCPCGERGELILVHAKPADTLADVAKGTFAGAELLAGQLVLVLQLENNIDGVANPLRPQALVLQNTLLGLPRHERLRHCAILMCVLVLPLLRRHSLSS